MWEGSEGLGAEKTLVPGSVIGSLVPLVYESLRVVVVVVVVVERVRVYVLGLRPIVVFAVGNDAVDIQPKGQLINVPPRHAARTPSALDMRDQRRERHEPRRASIHGTDEAFRSMFSRLEMLSEVIGALEIAGASDAVVVHVDPVLVQVERCGDVRVAHVAPVVCGLLMFGEALLVVKVLLAVLAEVVGW
jgi:hypothetical protein